MFLFFKNFFKKLEAKIFLSLLLREIVVILVFTIAIFLTLESILPGTVSVRMFILFFILGISVALVAESSVSKTIPEIQNRENANKKNFHFLHGSKKEIFLSVMLFSWVTFLIGSSSIGFPPAIIVILIIFTSLILWLFFKIIFDSLTDTQ